MTRQRVALPWDTAPPRPAPDQTRYGPRGVTIDGDRKRLIAYTNEGGGVVATCKGCGYEVYGETRQAAERAARDNHKKCKGAKDDD